MAKLLIVVQSMPNYKLIIVDPEAKGEKRVDFKVSHGSSVQHATERIKNIMEHEDISYENVIIQRVGLGQGIIDMMQEDFE